MCWYTPNLVVGLHRTVPYLATNEANQQRTPSRCTFTAALSGWCSFPVSPRPFPFSRRYPAFDLPLRLTFFFSLAVVLCSRPTVSGDGPRFFLFSLQRSSARPFLTRGEISSLVYPYAGLGMAGYPNSSVYIMSYFVLFILCSPNIK